MAFTGQESIDLFLGRVLHTLLGRHGAEQIFLFGPAGEPFWCARPPLTSDDLRTLQQALGLIERLEAERPKPFIGHDPGGRFSVAALGRDSDLHVVCVHDGVDAAVAEARVVQVRDALEPRVANVRNGRERSATGYRL
ncbi:MAG: hypothetical protein QM765_20480 [Myxococcales bacterium]